MCLYSITFVLLSVGGGLVVFLFCFVLFCLGGCLFVCFVFCFFCCCLFCLRLQLNDWKKEGISGGGGRHKVFRYVCRRTRKLPTFCTNYRREGGGGVRPCRCHPPPLPPPPPTHTHTHRVILIDTVPVEVSCHGVAAHMHAEFAEKSSGNR